MYKLVHKKDKYGKLQSTALCSKVPFTQFGKPYNSQQQILKSKKQQVNK